MAETDQFARKRQQLEQLKTDLENKLGASRVEWKGQFVKAIHPTKIIPLS